MKDKVLLTISKRINENKYQKIHLKPFIESDRLKGNELDRVIDELEQLYDTINTLYEYKKEILHIGTFT